MPLTHASSKGGLWCKLSPLSKGGALFNSLQGMELYINWIAGAGNTHDVFFTDPRIIASYRKLAFYAFSVRWVTYIYIESYVRTIVERYKNSPNIFAWELMNEARCSGDILPSGPSCTPASGAESLLKWYKSQSDFVRSL